MIEEQVAPSPCVIRQQNQRTGISNPICAKSSEIQSALNAIPIIIPNLNSKVNQKIYVITSKAVRELKHHQTQNQKQQQQTQQQPLQKQQSKSNKKIISVDRLPFLPNRPPTVHSVKKNQLPPVEEIPNTINPSSPDLNTVNILIDTDCQNYSTNCLLNNNKYKKNNSPIIHQNTKQRMQPMTLTAMAGIQLTTGVDVSAADMSGVVPTATTVEEINVPVFIDAGLQEATPTTLATTTTAATELYNCNNNSKKTYYSNEEKEDFGEDIFENLEFDFEDFIVSTSGEVKEQQQQEQLQQLIISEIPLYNNIVNNYNNIINNNTNNINNNTSTKVSENKNINNYNNSNNYNSNNMLNTVFLKSEPTINEHFDIWEEMDLMKNEELGMYDDTKSEQKIYNGDDDILEQQYRLLPGTLEDSQITVINDNEIEIMQSLPEDAVYFENGRKQPDLSDVLTNSQENPLLGCAININSQLQSQPFSQLLDEEPFVPEYNEFDAATTSCNNTNDNQTNILGNENNNHDIKGIMRKRLAINKEMQDEKPKKFRLDLSQISPSSSICSLNTPDILNDVMEMKDEAQYVDITKHYSPYNLLDEHDKNSISQLHSPFEILTPPTLCDQDVIIDVGTESSPVTPQSDYSTSQHTSFSGDYNNFTAPNSPALSYSSSTRQSFNSSSNNINIHNSSINSDSSTTPGKKKRGRPAKKHSDEPNPELLKHLSESERKRMNDRAKNNEASRLSREKNNKRKLEEIDEEKQLEYENQRLKTVHDELERKINKFKRAVERNYLEK